VVSLEQYVQIVPDPTVKLEQCNSTSDYNGHLDDSVICTGPRSEKLPCKVSTFNLSSGAWNRTHELDARIHFTAKHTFDIEISVFEF
jgi:hypothetical protein